MIKEYILLNKKQIEHIEKYWINVLNKDELNQYIYSKAFHDIQYFWMFFLPHFVWKKYWKHQIEIIEKARSKENINIIIPRWHWKTTTITIDLLHSMLYKIYKSQIYVATAWLWEETLWKISSELQSNLLIREVFWDLIPKQDKETKEAHWAKKFRQRHIELLNGVKLESVSKWQAIRWKRPERIVVDDIDKEAPNPSEWKKTREWFFWSLYNTLLPGWKVIVIWTIVWNLCLVKQLKDKWWNTIEYQAIINGKPLWAEMWSMEELQTRKEEIWSLMFNQEYMNIPLNSEDTIIKEEMLKFFSLKNDDIQFDFIYMWLDPAISEKQTADDFWITITWISWKNRYVLKNIWLKWTQKTTENRKKTIKRLYEEYDVDRIYIEDNGFQALIKDEIKSLNMAAQWITSVKDKVTRLLIWQGSFETWTIYFNIDDDETLNLQQQLLQFPDVPHDDLVDSMVLSFWQKTKKKKKIQVAWW